LSAAHLWNFFLCLNFKPTETQVLAFLTTEKGAAGLQAQKKTPQISVETDHFSSHFSPHYSQDKTTLLGQTHTTDDTQSWDKKILPFGCQHSKRNVYS
jgi:hypothetical protein